MATHDYVIANGTGAAVRSDLNNALAAIVSNNSSSSEPGTTYAYQWWADTNANVLKIRNSSNDGWITLRELDGTMLIEDGSAGSPGLAFASDLDTGFFRSADNRLNITTGGTERLEIGSSEAVFNDPSDDYDFRVESNNSTHMLFVDAGNDRVGIGASSPNGSLSVQADSGRLLTFRNSTTGTGASDGSYITLNGSDLQISNAESAKIIFYTGDTERKRIDEEGRTLIGSTSSVAPDGSNNPALQVNRSQSAAFNASILIREQEASTSFPKLILNKNRGGNAMQTDNGLGGVDFYGDDSSSEELGARIEAAAAGNWSTTSCPTNLIFFTTASGATSPTERFRIRSDGMVELRANQGTAETNVIRFTDTDSSVAAAQKFGQLQWFSNDASGGGPCVKGEIYVVARDTTPDGDMVFATHDGSGTNTAENIRLISSGGITFNGDTAEANALNDYEEGTWTATLSVGTCTTSDAKYVKIGKLVRVSATLSGFSDRSSSLGFQITNAPFASNGGQNAQAAGAQIHRNLDLAAIVSYMSSTGNVEFYAATSGSWSQLAYNDLNSSSSTIYFFAQWMTN